MDSASESGQRSRWIGPAGWGLIAFIAGAFAIAWLGGRLLTDRLTIHNRTTTPVSFTVDAFGSYPNYVAACGSSEFVWKQDGNRSGWTPAGARDWQGGAIEVGIPVERSFEAGPADHFMVLVTSDGLTLMEPDAPLPDCDGMPPG